MYYCQRIHYRANNFPENAKKQLSIIGKLLYIADYRYRWPGSNRHSRRNTILSRARLPIPPHRQVLERKTGFEPATPTLARWCSTTELLPHIIKIKKNRMSDQKILEAATGFEPVIKVLQTCALPLG